MYGEVKLMDPKSEEMTVPMLANAATPIRFKSLFHSDLLSGILTTDGSFDVDVVSKLAFIMAKQAAKADMNSLSMDHYIEWLEGFDSMAFYTNAQAIFDVYSGSKKNSSKAKK